MTPLTPDQIDQKLRQIITDQLMVDDSQIVPTASFYDDLGADSLDQVELLMAVEDEFRDFIKDGIPQETADGLKTYKDVFDYVVARQNAARTE